MYNFTLLKQYLVLITIAIFSISSYAGIYETTEVGGVWSDNSTWVQGNPPLSNTDTVIVNGILNVNGNYQIDHITVDTNATLQNHSSNIYTLSTRVLINHGIIKNNVYTFYINVAEDIVHKGIITNYQIRLGGSTTHNVDADSVFRCSNFRLNNAGGTLNILSDFFHFENCVVDLYNANAVFGNGSLSLDGGHIKRTNITADQLDLFVNSGAYISTTSIYANHIDLYGTVNIQNGVYFYDNTSNVVAEVHDILQNNSSNNYTLHMNGDLVNHNTIKDNVYNFTINLEGNLVNNGSWTNQHTYLTGNATQEIELNLPFGGEALTNSNTNGYLRATSKLEFVNTNIDLNSDTLFYNNNIDTISLSGGYLKEFKLIGDASPFEITLSLTNGAYVENGLFDYDESYLINTFQFKAPMTIFGNATNQNTFRNYSNYNHLASIQGNFTNNGSVINHVYNLTLDITGNIANNGSWTNTTTNLSGTQDQNLFLNQEFSGSNLYNTNTSGKIIAQTDLSFNNTYFDMNLDTLEFAGGADSLSINGNEFKEFRIIRNGSKASGTFKVNLIGGARFDNTHITADQIDLYGTFQFESTMNFYGNVTNYGTLRNYSSYFQTASVFGNITNEGTVTDHVYYLSFYISGDLLQNNTWNNSYTYLNSPVDQSLYLNQPFEGANLTNNNTDGKIIAQTNLVFNNTKFEMNNDTLEFAATADSLVFNANELKNARLVRNNAEVSGTMKINTIGGAYFTNISISADDIWLYGLFQFQTNAHFYGNVYNMGTLRNFSSYIQYAYVHGDIYNYGSINDNVYNLYIYLDGDIHQHGVWTCRYSYLTAAVTRTIEQTKPFAGYSFTNNVAGSTINVNSDFVFQDTRIDLNNATVVLPDNAVLSVKGGYFIKADLSTDGVEVFMNGGSYLQDISLISPTLYGDILIHNNVTFSGHTTVMGTLRNHSSFFKTLYVNGSIENHGSILNNVYQFYMYVQEDILNNGTWANQWTQLEGYAGSINQTVELQDGHYITGQLRLFSNNSSNFLWYKNNSPLTGNPDYSGVSSQVLNFLVPADNIRAGEYKCNTLAGWSRNIYITTTTSSYPEVDLTVFLEGPFEGAGMNTDLNASGSLPLTQPFNVFPYNYGGVESVASIPNGNVVDWVLVEYRDAINNDNAFKSTQIERKAAFLLADGSVVNLDGSSNLDLMHAVSDNLFVLVHHRNHLGVMSAASLNETGGIYDYDFTTDNWKSYGGPLAAKNVGSAGSPVYAIMGGESNGDGVVDASDFLIWQTVAGQTTSYNNGDFNLDGQFDNQDKNDVWIENQGAGLQYPD